ncbi:MAG TPA: TetM/TetW/TetO/TetS family tetracycline resistance ribosomal protection protein, partial [Pseudobdellovibrionaceae bacterium]|nr:TetM/TetW/TetO/TetS family tetracycline resistance ribosomal protection protein [Pseudobdellovibrionaceae bacterium]
ELDDRVLGEYLDGVIPSPETLKSVLRAGTLSLKVTPVLCGSAFKNKGIQPLLDAVVDFLPSPLEVPPVKGFDPDRETKEIVCHTSFAEPVACLAFKVANDPFAGSLTYVRVYSGVMKVGDQLLNSRTQKKERIQKIVKMHANTREEIQELRAGDIGAVIGLKFTGTGDTLCASGRPVVLESIRFPEPVIAVAVEAKSTAEQEKMLQGLQRLEKEDPSCRLRIDPETGQYLLAGMGELHLEILIDRLLREYKIKANVGRPQVSYREAIRSHCEATHVYERQIGGESHFASVRIALEPLPLGEGVKFESRVVADKSFTAELLKSVESGFRETCEVGPLTSSSMLGIKGKLLAVETRPDQSSPMAFKAAAALAVRDALKTVEIDILEPYFKVEVTCPDEFVGNVVGDLNSRRGKIHSMGVGPQGLQLINAEVPLASMFGYATEVRSLSQGRASFSMEFSTYTAVPPKVRQEILSHLGR